MTPLDLTILKASRNVLGRSAFTLLCQPFTATVADPGGGATQMSIILPAPQQGFIRSWDYMTVIWGAPAAGDCLLLNLTPKTVNFFIAVASLRFATGLITEGTGPSEWPLVGAVHNVNGALPICYFGTGDVLAAPEDQLKFTAIFTAASGQTATLKARFCDFPA